MKSHTKLAAALLLLVGVVEFSNIAPALARGGAPSIMNSPGYQRRLQESGSQTLDPMRRRWRSTPERNGIIATTAIKSLSTSYQASMQGRLRWLRGSGFGTDRRPAMIQRRVSAGSITSSISMTDAI